jgi:hypothetical protein
MLLRLRETNERGNQDGWCRLVRTRTCGLALSRPPVDGDD